MADYYLYQQLGHGLQSSHHGFMHHLFKRLCLWSKSLPHTTNRVSAIRHIVPKWFTHVSHCAQPGASKKTTFHWVQSVK